MNDIILQLIHWINEARQTAANFRGVGLVTEAAAWERAAADRQASLERNYLAPIETYAARKPGPVADRVTENLRAFRASLRPA